MSLFKKVAKQGEVLVERDASNTITRRAPAPTADMPKIVNWRRQARALTDNGLDMLRGMINIANGVPVISTLEDGSHTEPMAPTVMERLTAQKSVWELIHGKAVAQTEVMKAEKEAEDTAQYAALSDEALMEAARPFLERVEREKLGAGEEEEGEIEDA